MSAVDDAPDCVCGDPRCEHKRGTGGCKNPECGCGKYDPINRSTPAGPVLDVGALLAEAQGDADREAELAARLAKVERERDEARAEQIAALERHRITWGLERDACVKLRGERDMAQAKLDGALLQLAQVTDERNTLRNAVPCGWCDGLGVAPGERFGRDADGAPNVDEGRPCPEGCAVPAWLQAERNDAADDARLLQEAQQRIAQLVEHEQIRARVIHERNVQLTQMEQRIAQLQHRALHSYDAWQCDRCGRRYTRDTAAVDHACGPMQPVTVTVSRRPAQDTTTENRSTTE